MHGSWIDMDAHELMKRYQKDMGLLESDLRESLVEDGYVGGFYSSLRSLVLQGDVSGFETIVNAAKLMSLVKNY